MRPLAERLDASGWSVQLPPVSSTSWGSGSRNQLSGVACTGVSGCVAVGDYFPSRAQGEVSYAWNGSSSVQIPVGQSALGAINAVSCTSTCTAVGSSQFMYPTPTPLTAADLLSGGSWSGQQTPNPTGAGETWLHGISCSTAEACVAVGEGRTSMLALIWNGSSWTPTIPPAPAGTSSVWLSSVSCTAPDACTAVGGSYDPTTRQNLPVVERWNGSSWTLQPTPIPAGARDAVLEAISCTGATACTAVGDQDNASTGSTLAESWDGTSWSIQPTPPLPGSSASGFLGVSCTSANACTAVGSCQDCQSRTRSSLAEFWNGTSWTIQPTPNPSNADTGIVLYSVSCPTPSFCTAAGVVFPSSTVLPITETWNGTNWTLENLATPPDAVDSFLNAVSCPSATTCIAVGDYSTTAAPRTTAGRTLVETWDGTAWTVQPSPNATPLPNPFGYISNTLQGVSCPTTTACMAAGWWDENKNLTLTERYTG